MRIILTLLAITMAGMAQQRRPWHIKGQFSEACTCSVPCTCNFGERPSPYDYCYTMWSYWVQEGNWDQVKLKDLRIAGVDGPRGVLALMDVRADLSQRAAMENIWQAVSGRLLCMLRLWPFKAGAAEPAPGKLPRQGSVIRTRFPDRRFLGFEYIQIDQAITDRGVKLTFADRGGFEAAYIFGRDPTKPVTVTNNVSWPVAVSIKGKTILFKYKDQYNELEYQGTNSNQGRFDLSHTQPSGTPMTAPR